MLETCEDRPGSGPLVDAGLRNEASAVATDLTGAGVQMPVDADRGGVDLLVKGVDSELRQTLVLFALMLVLPLLIGAMLLSLH